MGSKSSQELKQTERQREFELRKSNLDVHRFNKLQKFLPQLSFDQPIDDLSEETYNARMHHNFLDPTSKYRSNPFKRMVSQKKIRFQNDVFDLDLCYITKRVIAMAYPSTGHEGLYRNSRDDVLSFLNTYHPTHFKIYNLCRELRRFYQSSKFYDSPVAYFPIIDHNPCDLITMLEFCVDAFLYLSQHPENVVVIHCKAGKGRTGLMICSFLVFTEGCATADDAIALYGRRRTSNGQGITIPSQKRYVRYFHQMLQDFLVSKFRYKIQTLVGGSNSLRRIKQGLLRRIELVGVNIGPGVSAKKAKITITKTTGAVVWAGTLEATQFNYNFAQFTFPAEYFEEEDFKINFKSKALTFSCWLNCYFFVDQCSRELPRIHNKPLLCIELQPAELDTLATKLDRFTVVVMGYDLKPKN